MQTLIRSVLGAVLLAGVSWSAAAVARGQG